MDKYSVTLRTDEIRRLAESKQYKKALNIIDSLDINKIKVVTDLSIFAEVFEQNNKYDDAKDLLLRIYDKKPTRRIVNQLVNLDIKMKNCVEAEEHYEEYLYLAPTDMNRFILRYRLDKAEEKPYEVLIKDLEELKEEEYMEEWAYELAKLYHKAGYKDKCVRECSDIQLWFGEGIYVEKAKLLKEYYVGNNDRITAFRAMERRAIEQDKELQKTKEFSKEIKEIDEILEGLKDNEQIDSNEKEEIKKEEIEEEIEVEEIKVEEIEEKIEEEIKEETKVEETKVEETENEIETNLEEETEETRNKAETIEDIIVNHVNISDIFGNFINIRTIRGQLKSLFKNEEKARKSKHIMIVGPKGSAKTNFAKSIAKTYVELGYNRNPQIGKINGEKLNHMSLENKQDKLAGGCLVIENTGILTKTTVDKLVQMMDLFGDDIMVIVEDTETSMVQLMNTYPKLTEYFVDKIDIPEYNLEELFGFALDYFEKEEYILEEDARSKLYGYTEQIVLNINPEDRLKTLLGKAIEAKTSAENRNILKLKRIVEDNKYKESDIVMIKSMDIDFDF